jgi:hypothetical protein
MISIDFVVRPTFERVSSRRRVLVANTGDKRTHASASD